MKQLKTRYVITTILGILASLAILAFLAVGTIGGDSAIAIPWAMHVAGSKHRFGILNISYRYFLNLFFCFGQSGWVWDFSKIAIAGVFWAAVVGLIVAIIVYAKREKKGILPAIFIFLNICGGLWVIEGVTYTNYMGVMKLRYAASFALCIALGLFAIFALSLALSASHQIKILESQGCNLVNELEGRIKVLEDKVAEFENKEPVAKVEEVKPVIEETKVEEVVIETPVEEKTGNLNIQRIPFAVKYKEADKDLRDKFDELSAYITNNYGIKARESIAGVSFSAHREKLVFVTVIGKHLRCNFALDANNYNDSTLPVVNSDNKKYADVPLTLKVKSGLSLRRAMSLVDDVMASKGIKKKTK